MANNVAVPFGFRPASLYGSSPPNYALNVANIAYNNTNKIAYGDPVIINSSGYIDLYTNGTNNIFGIFAGCEYPNSTSVGGVSFSPNWPGVALSSSTAVVTARIITDPTMTFMAQLDGTAATQTDIGYNVDITSATSGAPNAAGFSVCSLSSTSMNTTSTLPFRIVGIVGLGDIFATGPIGPFPGYVATNGLNCLYVKFNTSSLLNTTGV